MTYEDSINDQIIKGVDVTFNKVASVNQVEFNKCKFITKKHEMIVFEKVTFCNCDLNNKDFNNCLFSNCSFKSCNIVGSSFRNCNITNSTIIDCKANYLYISKTKLFDFKIVDSCLIEGSFHDISFKDTFFDNVDFTRSIFERTSLKGKDLSNCKISLIAITNEDIKGAIIDTTQVYDIVTLLGIRVK